MFKAKYYWWINQQDQFVSHPSSILIQTILATNWNFFNWPDCLVCVCVCEFKKVFIPIQGSVFSLCPLHHPSRKNQVLYNVSFMSALSLSHNPPLPFSWTFQWLSLGWVLRAHISWNCTANKWKNQPVILKLIEVPWDDRPLCLCWGGHHPPRLDEEAQNPSWFQHLLVEVSFPFPKKRGDS